MAFEFKLPDIGEGVHEGEIVKWHVKVGDAVEADKALVEVMTDKVTVEITSPVSGVIEQLFFAEGQQAKVGQVIVAINESASPKATAKKEITQNAQKTAVVQAPPLAVETSPQAATALCDRMPASQSTENTSNTPNAKVLAPPAVRKLARELGISLAAVVGSGPDGRIRKPDLMAAAGGNGAVAAKSIVHVPKADHRVAFKGIRRKIAEHLVHAKQTAPHFTYVEEADMSGVVEAREQLLPLAEQCGVKLTFLPMIIKAVIRGLQKYPILNSSLDEEKQEIILKGAFNIGVAMATEQGLVVPVIHNADQLSLFELAREIDHLSQLARSNKLPLEKMQGGTFTLTSIGSIGGIFSAPIINYPEVAIMGIQKIEKRPVVRDDQIVIREMTYLSISCDHRVVDGAEAALFMKEMISWLEHPYRLLTDC